MSGADPLYARELVVEDALHSRGLIVSDRELLDEQHELEQDLRRTRSRSSSSGRSVDRKGKGRAIELAGAEDGPAHSGRQPYDDSRDPNEDDEEDEESRYLAHGRDASSENIPLHHRHRRRGRRRSPSHASHSQSETTGKRARNRAGSIMGGLLEKNTLPEAGTSKQELRSMYIRRIAINILFIMAWYTFSTLISLYNKWMFSPEHYGFGFPLFVTSCHMLVQFTLCAIVLSIFPSLRPSHRPEPRGYVTKVAPCGLATGLDIGLSNLSLKTITLSFYTMCKSSVLGFVLLFAFLFRLEKPTLPLIGIIGIITGGVIMMVSSETQFHLVGMMQVLTASCLSGLRWSLTQILLDKESMGMNNPFATLFWLAPIMGISLAICSIFIEGWFTLFSSEFFQGFDRILITMAVILLPGVLAFCMNTAEFALIQRTSVVTLSVAGIFKEVATILLSTVVFHDQLTPINISGLCVALFGIALYNYLKYRNYRIAEKAALRGGALPSSNGSASHHDHRISLEEDRDPERQQFQLVGEEDFLSSDEDESDSGRLTDSKQRARLGLGSLADERAAESVVHLSSYAETHPDKASETERMENEVKKDTLLLDLDREEHQLEEAMSSKRL